MMHASRKKISLVIGSLHFWTSLFLAVGLRERTWFPRWLECRSCPADSRRRKLQRFRDALPAERAESLNRVPGAGARGGRPEPRQDWSAPWWSQMRCGRLISHSELRNASYATTASTVARFRNGYLQAVTLPSVDVSGNQTCDSL